MSDNDPSPADPFGQIVDEFVEALRQGGRPSVEEFARRYPRHADEIRDVLPTLMLLEEAKTGRPAARPSSGLGSCQGRAPRDVGLPSPVLSRPDGRPVDDGQDHPRHASTAKHPSTCGPGPRR
jgi:hypothetical protein